MPCYDPRSSPVWVREDTLREATHNSPVAELLCWTLKSMELPTRAKFLAANPALARWWSQHQERDRQKSEPVVTKRSPLVKPESVQKELGKLADEFSKVVLNGKTKQR